MKVVFKGSGEGSFYPYTAMKRDKIYRAELNNDFDSKLKCGGDYYNLFDLISGVKIDWCEIDEVDILADIREQRINEILNDETL